MHQQPTQTGQWPIPGPPQHEHHYYPPMPQSSSVPSHVRPYPPDPHAHLDNQFAHADHPVYGAPYPVHPPQHWGEQPLASQAEERTVKRGKRKAQDLHEHDAPPSKRQAIRPLVHGNQHHTQGLGQQAPAPPSHPAASPLAQTYHHHTQQGLGQQPVVATEESDVKRGKRKAVDVDDDPPPTGQAIQPRIDDFNIIPINSSTSRGYSSYMVASSSKTHEEAVARVAPVDSASGEQSQECINSPDETGDLARDDLMNSFVKADDPDLNLGIFSGRRFVPTTYKLYILDRVIVVFVR
ncbi:hypothetical protein P692DRAFT_201799284 [Suillus brevipes Sb2]|nr:hypothetical protein P692DRAFT_201799284 [Suillus brevipes Sb2]